MSMDRIPINKGNYSMDTSERELAFHAKLSEGWAEEYKQYRENWAEWPRKQFVSDYPLLVDLELASICNLRCPMCYTISPDFRKKVNAKIMNYELYTKIIDEIGGKVPAIRLSLRGEATVHPRFIDCIRYAKSRGIKEVSTLTHGGKLSLPFFVSAQEAGIDWITISVDGVGETYERIRKPIKFDEILSKVIAIKRYKAQHKLSKPVIKIQGIWPAIAEDPDLYYDTFSPHVDLVAFNPLIDYLNKDQDIDYVEEFTCPQQYQRLVIGADGLVMKCSNDEDNQEIIADANVDPVNRIWKSEALQRVRDLHKKKQGFLESPVCRKCYLPRKTEDERAYIGDREILISNYTKRSQAVGG